MVVYPFLFMDIAEGNALPDPWTGDAGQPVYPWRGRITCDPAPGQPGTVDKTGAATGQVASFFGSVTRSQISVSVNGSTNAVATSYSGPSEWSFRRFILHYAKLCGAIDAIEPNAIDGFIIGSELRGLCQVRDSGTHFPAVDRLKDLAGDARAILGSSVKVGYAADWSDYCHYQPGDGGGDLFFHLDPLWADPNVDFVGIDLYVPLSDWREGPHLDAEAGATSIYDRAYLQSNIEGGEYFDWYYASDADRDAQIRTPITDGAYGKPWVYRAKDVRSWWLNQHFNRPGGVEAGSATAWVPQSKPVWFTEFGIPSVDKGTNQPNVFYDPKSSESALPWYSRGNRDDLIQRRGIEAVLSYWSTGSGNNPLSSVYGGRMIGTISIWTWDARPYPAWPARTDAWGDGPQWPLGHWLTGKIGLADLGALVAERCARVGFVAIDVSGLFGVVTGYVRDQPMSPRAEIEMLMNAFAFDAVESEGVIRFVPRGRTPVASIEVAGCVLPEQGEIATLIRAEESDLPDIVSITFIDGNGDYQSGSISSSRLAGWSERKSDLSLALVMDELQAQTMADRALAEAWIGRETARVGLPPSLVAVDPGDVLDLIVDGRPRSFRLTRILDSGPRAVEAQRTEAAIYATPLPGIAPPVFMPPTVYGRALLEIMDLPLLQDSDFHLEVVSSDFSGLRIRINGTPVASKLVGLFNAYNAAAVIGAATLLNERFDRVVAEVEKLEPVEGRMERIAGPHGITVVVDFAHTPDALEKVLANLASMNSAGAPIITIVGCGGDRDREKRPIMGEIAAKLSNQVIFTSDNPRSESAERIIEEMMAGVPLTLRNRVSVVADRKKAIQSICAGAPSASLILIAGKGHEKYQEIQGERRPFDDVALARASLEHRAAGDV